MNKKDMLKAWREALKQAQEMLDFYKGYIKSAEDLENKDTSELFCLGSFFNWCPNSGCNMEEEEQAEQMGDLLRQAERRAKREAEKRAYNKEQKELSTMRYYAVKFYEVGEDKPLVSMLVQYRGKASNATALEIVLKQYPQYAEKVSSVEALSEAEYIASKTH